MLLSCALLLAMTATAPREQPDAVVRRLYEQVVARRPMGIPGGADMDAIGPLLSRRRVRDLETARACEADYFRQFPDPMMKPTFGWLELGLFSGGTEQAIPREFAIERTEKGRRGTHRVTVRLTYRETFETYGRPPDPNDTFSWNVAAIVTSEDGRFVVDDILLFEEDSSKVWFRLSKAFGGCDGPRWTGR
jgi:hypothetical protein